MNDPLAEESASELQAKETFDLPQLGNCARCKQDHEDLTFEKLEYPHEVKSEVWTHWAPCPTNGQPIMLTILDEDEYEDEE
jgi:hypothetical protein